VVSEHIEDTGNAESARLTMLDLTRGVVQIPFASQHEADEVTDALKPPPPESAALVTVNTTSPSAADDVKDKIRQDLLKV
jgi:hypothetical protein